MRPFTITNIFLILLAVCVLSHASIAQMIPTVLPLSQPASPPSAPLDPLGRSTPKSMIKGFLQSVGSENYEQAAAYLDLKGLPASRQKSEGPALAKDLQTLLDQRGWVETDSKLSDSADGNKNDELAPDVDLVGTIRAGEKSIDILAERHDSTDNGPIWQISKDTVANIPVLLKEVATGPLDKLLPSALIDNKWYGVPLGHWLAILTIAALALMPSWLLTLSVIRFIKIILPVTRTGHAHHVLGALFVPIRIYIALGIFVALARATGISIVARQHFMLLAEIAAWLSLWWFLWSIIDVIAHSVQDRMTREKRRRALSSVIFFRRSARLVLAAAAIALTMTKIGMNVTGWFAALGIGGVALAFGAKTTLENFIVGLTLIIDQPLRIGDFCRIGDIQGTVEDIGMRSTRLTTLDRTTVTIPNGTLSTFTIENYSQRTSFWFHPILSLRYETTPEQIRHLLKTLEDFLLKQPLVDKKNTYVRLLELGKDSLNVEVFSYIIMEDYNEFLKLQGDLLLRIMEIVNENGLEFAFPSQTIYLAKDSKSARPPTPL
jgi:MscS family membrane protein